MQRRVNLRLNQKVRFHDFLAELRAKSGLCRFGEDHRGGPFAGSTGGLGRSRGPAQSLPSR